ncbi:MAG: M48 family metallopeptidase [Rhodocyclaceae bacterium]|nr:M48 family metallopeptidase [Rhodocyclaceae bacterium]
MKARNPQLSLRLETAAPSVTLRWCEGARLPYRGRDITLHLSRECREAELHGDLLHLPLPPEALPRQIQDAAEAWLQREALSHFNAAAQRQAARYGTVVLPCVLSFALNTSWVEADSKGGEPCLRCNWRLIGQPDIVIEQVVGAVVAALPQAVPMLDLFGNPVQ